MLAVAVMMLQAATVREAAPVDIVVVARKRRCGVQLKGTELSSRDFDRYARIWAAGQEVRIATAPGASYRCLAKIMSRLADHGVTRATFVDRPPS